MPLPARVTRYVAAGVLLCSLVLGLGACQFQSLQPNTPADGVNTSVGAVQVRNLAIFVTESGQGVLSGTIVADEDDTLIGAGGAALKPDGTPGADLQITSASRLPLQAGVPVVLTEEAIHVSSPDLRAGLTAQVQLAFSNAGAVSIVVPLLDANSARYPNLELPEPSSSTNQG
ncbi:hypothetical protein ACQBAU_03455 [Propionibacteriaceae bacterium Y2011]|uniref:hypothetical protein n=1 Tax=Microlunatus sp. Y2014 TaxID=3418488 RepID=UPI003B4B7A13